MKKINDFILTKIEMELKMKKLYLFITAFVLLTLVGCNKTNKDVPIETSRVGAMTGTTGERYIESTYPNAKLRRYDSIPDAVMALQGNKIDYVITAYTTALNYAKNNKDLVVLSETLVDEGCAIAVSKENPELLSEISNSLEKFKKDGTLDKIISNWIKEDGGNYNISEIPKKEDGKILKVGIAANREPMCFVSNGKIVGLDSELIEQIAYVLGMKVEFVDMQFSALITSLQSGKVDVLISNITATDERKQKVDFTEDYFKNPQVLLKRR